MVSRIHIENTRCYQIRFSGQLEEDFLASFCTNCALTRTDDDQWVLTNVVMDQAGLIGLFRQLHNLGCVILGIDSIERGV